MIAPRDDEHLQIRSVAPTSRKVRDRRIQARRPEAASEHHNRLAAPIETQMSKGLAPQPLAVEGSERRAHRHAGYTRAGETRERRLEAHGDVAGESSSDLVGQTGDDVALVDHR